MLERNIFALGMMCFTLLMLTSSCQNRAAKRLAEEKPNPKVRVGKGQETAVLPAPELVQSEPEIVLPEPSYLLLRLEKTACYGECPVFEVKCYSDGRTIWKGAHYCDRIGYYETFLPKTWREQLLSRAKAIRFFSLLDHYPAEGPYLSELPNTIVYLNDGKKEKSISQNYLTPKELIAFEEEVLKLMDKLNWEAVKEQN